MEKALIGKEALDEIVSFNNELNRFSKNLETLTDSVNSLHRIGIHNRPIVTLMQDLKDKGLSNIDKEPILLKGTNNDDIEKIYEIIVGEINSLKDTSLETNDNKYNQLLNKTRVVTDQINHVINKLDHYNNELLSKNYVLSDSESKFSVINKPYLCKQHTKNNVLENKQIKKLTRQIQGILMNKIFEPSLTSSDIHRDFMTFAREYNTQTGGGDIKDLTSNLDNINVLIIRLQLLMTSIKRQRQTLSKKRLDIVYYTLYLLLIASNDTETSLMFMTKNLADFYIKVINKLRERSYFKTYHKINLEKSLRLLEYISSFLHDNEAIDIYASDSIDLLVFGRLANILDSQLAFMQPSVQEVNEINADTEVLSLELSLANHADSCVVYDGTKDLVFGKVDSPGLIQTLISNDTISIGIRAFEYYGITNLYQGCKTSTKKKQYRFGITNRKVIVLGTRNDNDFTDIPVSLLPSLHSLFKKPIGVLVFDIIIRAKDNTNMETSLDAINNELLKKNGTINRLHRFIIAPNRQSIPINGDKYSEAITMAINTAPIYLSLIMPLIVLELSGKKTNSILDASQVIHDSLTDGKLLSRLREKTNQKLDFSLFNRSIIDSIVSPSNCKLLDPLDHIQEIQGIITTTSNKTNLLDYAHSALLDLQLVSKILDIKGLISETTMLKIVKKT